MDYSFEDKLSLLKTSGALGMLGGLTLGGLALGGTALAANKLFDVGKSWNRGSAERGNFESGLQAARDDAENLYRSGYENLKNKFDNTVQHMNLESLAKGNGPAPAQGLTEQQKNLALYGGAGLLGIMALRGGGKSRSVDELTALVKSRMGR